MAQFKVGDRVIAISDYMEKEIRGKTGTVRGFGTIKYDPIGVEFDEDIGGHSGGAYFDGKEGHCWFVPDDCIAIIHTLSIHITTDGKTTHAVLKGGGKVTKRAKAICSPSDEFDFETGARIAFDRLVGNPVDAVPGTVREVKRPAKVGEWVKFVEDHGGGLTPGSIHQVESERNGTLLFSGGFMGYICGNHSKYVVLEGYTPEPEKPAFRPHLECKGENYGYIGEPTKYKDAVGRPLAVGDEVELFKYGESHGRCAVVQALDNFYNHGKKFVMGIEMNCDGKSSIGDVWKIIKTRPHSEIPHGEEIGCITYIKEQP